MRKLVVPWLIAVLLGLVAGGRPASVAAGDPPPLQPPILSPEGRQPDPANALPDPASRKVDVRRNGPPIDMPEDRPGPAPGPGYFWIPGQYFPAGGGVTWRPGFWARSQPGWEWIPARWDHQDDGWTYREGRWVRTARADTGRDPEPSGRRVVARPPLGQTSPFSPAATTASSDPGANATTDLQPLPGGGLTPRPENEPDGRRDAIRQPVPGPNSNVVPNPRGTYPPIPNPNPNPNPNPAAVYPGIPWDYPAASVSLPNGINIQVVPGQLPRITIPRLPYPGLGLPGVQVRPWPPLGGPR